MADDRVSRATAESVPLPPHTWYVRTVNELLNEDAVKKNITRVPLNEPLAESLAEHGMKSPLLVMPSWYPIAGSQRLRAMKQVVLKRPERGTQKVNVCRFDAEWWLPFYLWGDKDFRDKAVAIWFQMVELVWKSRYYIDDVDPSGEEMRHFERLGDQLTWDHKNKP